METKVCSKCGRELPIGKFSKSKDTKDGHKNECKMCRSLYSKEWRRKKLKAQYDECAESAQNTPQPLALKTKICAKCGKELPVGSFYIDRRNRSGYASYCKACQVTAVYDCRKQQLENAKNLRIAEFTTEDIITELKSRMSTWGLIKKLVFN